MQIEASILLVGTSEHNAHNMLFPKSIKSVFILVQCVTEQKLCRTFSNCSLCDKIKFEKNKFICTLCAYEISRRMRIFPQICIWQQTASNIRRISNLLKTFEVQTLSNSNSNFVTSLVENNDASASYHYKRRNVYFKLSQTRKPITLQQDCTKIRQYVRKYHTSNINFICTYKYKKYVKLKLMRLWPAWIARSVTGVL